MARGAISKLWRLPLPGLFAGLALQAAAAPSPMPAAAPVARTPIEHVIVVVGENHSFDNLFGLYEPPRGQTVANLLSRGIVGRDGRPGPNFALAAQRQAENHGAYSPIPEIRGTYTELPPLGYGSGAARRVVRGLPAGPFQISRQARDEVRTGDPVHRFFQMWQQLDGGRNDLFVWTADSAGGGSKDEPTAGKLRRGAVAMGFHNMAGGEVPVLRELAEQYALADNYHQAVMGGTSANYFALATADVATYDNAGGSAAPVARRIENPDARAGSNNRYTEDSYEGGTWVQCGEMTQPGVAGIRGLLQGLPYPAFGRGNCAPRSWYMVNNLDPAYTPAGVPIDRSRDDFRMPPQSMPSIGDALSAAGLSWKWYSGGRGDGTPAKRGYCATCDPLTSFNSTMTGPDRLRLQDLSRFFADTQDAATFPAVAFIAPDDDRSGHPGYSTLGAFEGLVKDIVARVRANPALWERTAILITFDEGGGYYDSGYEQLIDFFGDGTRVPLIAVSPHARHGHVGHNYYDHASITKFIRANWGLPPLSPRSRDNLPNPQHGAADPYVPLNRPAIGDLMDLFDFSTRP